VDGWIDECCLTTHQHNSGHSVSENCCEKMYVCFSSDKLTRLVLYDDFSQRTNQCLGGGGWVEIVNYLYFVFHNPIV